MIVGILFLAVFLVLTLFLKIYFIIAALESIMLGMLDLSAAAKDAGYLSEKPTECNRKVC